MNALIAMAVYEGYEKYRNLPSGFILRKKKRITFALDNLHARGTKFVAISVKDRNPRNEKSFVSIS